MEQRQLQVQDNMPSNSFHFRSIKNHEVNIVNICDTEIIGKTLSEGEFEIEISEDYFGGIQIDENKAIELLKTSNTLNLVGNNIVDLAIELDLASSDSIKFIENISDDIFHSFRNYNKTMLPWIKDLKEGQLEIAKRQHFAWKAFHQHH